MATRDRATRPGGDRNDGSDPSPPGAENKPLRHSTWYDSGYTAMTVLFSRVPPDATTLDIYNSLVPLAVTSIDILEDTRGERTGVVRVRLKPPKFNYWYDRTWVLQLQGPPPHSVLVSANVDMRGFRGLFEDSIKTPLNRWVLSQTNFELAMIGQGFLHQKRTMMVMDEVEHGQAVAGAAGTNIGLKVNFRRREFSIFVTRSLEEPPFPSSFDATNGAAPPSSRRLQVEYRIDIRFSWLQNVWEQYFPGGRVCVVMALSSPPEYWRKTRDAAKTHGNDRLSWTGMEQWVRMAFLTMNQRGVRDAAVSLHGIFPKGQSVDIGRWTTFRLGFNQSSVGEWKDVADHLRDYDVRVKPCPEFRFLPRDDRNMWDCVQDGSLSNLPSAPSSSNIHHLSRRLSFEVAYQLEVCISRNILHESTLDVVFLESLAALTPDRATRMLEYVAERGKRIYQPHGIFRDPKAASYWRKTPPDASLDKDRAVYIRKAIVTPTTILFSTPSLEAGNRVLRHFREHHDRFLRVQFTDEFLIGQLSGGRDSRRTDECFSRAFRALKNGIRVGGRHFEFLAFGNSQLRENSTYFFAPTELVSCQDIRDWMGDFRSIKTVAKYSARLGQCLSTTRPVPTFGVPTTIQRISDIERGRFCFTDGVGKISKWWARVIANHLRADDVPSAVQFRMGGCKGILAVWPDVPSGQVVQIRPSQEKFPTMGSANVLEIIRCSETATATLNQQTIILLSSLGVPSSVFLDLLQEELAGLDAVMKDPRMAVAQLMMRVDQNQTTPIIADMVKAGFMSSDEPFVWSLLQLWRSWTLKALKEKARISVEKSAFVLGCVDETDTLRGHSQKKNKEPNGASEAEIEEGVSELPQIFLQVPDLDGTPDGFTKLTRGNSQVSRGLSKYKVITGHCLVGRNPSLHPGDLRVVEAIDVTALHHLRDVVVFPRTGDRDIRSMCSGGDLDGDDYFVFWDERLLPPREFWNYEAMDYDAAREPDVDHVTPRHLISFFVQHMKHDTLPRIALSHRAYADQLEGSAMNPRCLELAQLHSQAVDYAKTGVPALMPHRLTPNVENFELAYDKPFDKRILDHYPDIDIELLRRARRIKTQYDLALRRAMAQKDIESEFEIWSGFAMNRPRVGSDYKTAEDIGRLFKVIMTRFRRLCLREVGGSLDIANLGPFVVAMYKVTHEEVCIALHEFALSHSLAHSPQTEFPDKESTPRNKFTEHIAPLISFPWLFAHELSSIAKACKVTRESKKLEKAAQKPSGPEGLTGGDAINDPPQSNKKNRALLLTSGELEKMEYRIQNGVPTHHGIPLDISAYDGSREEEDEGGRDEGDFKPLWTLPPGKSEGDIVIELVASTEPVETQREEDEYDGDDYDFLTMRFGRNGSASSKKDHNESNKKKAASGAKPFPWAEFEDDVLSTTSEESLGEDLGKIVIKRDDDNDDEDESHTEKSVGQTANNLVHDLPNGLKRQAAARVSTKLEKNDTQPAPQDHEAAHKEKSNVLPEEAADDADDEAEDEDDIFATVDSLFGDHGRRGKPIAEAMKNVAMKDVYHLDLAKRQKDSDAAHLEHSKASVVLNTVGLTGAGSMGSERKYQIAEKTNGSALDMLQSLFA